MIDGPIPEGLTFDDVLLLPGKSSVLPTEVDTRTCFTRKLSLDIPLASAAKRSASLDVWPVFTIPAGNSLQRH